MKDRSEQLGRYRAARDYIDRELVRLTPRRRSSAGKVATALRFNAELGDPQRACPSIQIAGTSGKGSVATLVAASLHAAGLTTGYHVSPYLQAFTEKTWIDGRYCSVDALAHAVEELRPVADRFATDDDCPASVHGMASLAASYLVFRDAGLDLAVMETGLGGRFDLVQGLHKELTVITDLGLDHLRSLGPTLEQIAWHKAGVMAPGVPCVALRGAGWEVLRHEAERVGAVLQPVDVERLLLVRDESRIVLRLPTLGELELELAGSAPFVARNAAVAAMALDTLAAMGRRVEPANLRVGFAARLPGRVERVQSEPRVVLDCAHNSQKLAALATALSRDSLTVVFAASGSRTPDDLLAALAPLTRKLVATELDLYGKSAVPAEGVASAGRRLGLDAVAVGTPERALETALQAAGSHGTVLVTGSVYLVGRLRDRWFPTDEVVLQRTSWPLAPATQRSR